MPIVTTYRRAFKPKKLDPYPVEILKRVDRPTTKIIDDQVQRVDERESGFNRARRGDFGPNLEREVACFVMWSMRNLPMMRRFAVWGDDLMGYGKPEPAFKWWFDLEDVEGELRVPPSHNEK